MRVLITGARGLLGAAIAREFTPSAEVHAFARQDLDVTDDAAVTDAVARGAPGRHRQLRRLQQRGRRRAGAGCGAARERVRRPRARPRRAAQPARRSSTTAPTSCSTARPIGRTPRRIARTRGALYAASKLLGDWFARDAPRAYVLRVESLFGDPGPDGGAPRQPRDDRRSHPRPAPRCRSSSIGPCRPAIPPTSRPRRARSSRASVAARALSLRERRRRDVGARSRRKRRGCSAARCA